MIDLSKIRAAAEALDDHVVLAVGAAQTLDIELEVIHTETYRLLEALTAAEAANVPPPEPASFFVDPCISHAPDGGSLPPLAVRDYGSVGPCGGTPSGRCFVLRSADGKRNEFRVGIDAPSRARIRLRVPAGDNGPSDGSSRTIVCQVHGGDNDGNPPLLSLEYFLRQREWRVQTCALPGNPYAEVWRTPLVFDTPVDFEFRSTWGRLVGGHEIFFNNKMVYQWTGPTDHATSTKPPYLKYGLYYPSAITDRWAVRTVLFEKVEAWK